VCGCYSHVTIDTNLLRLRYYWFCSTYREDTIVNLEWKLQELCIKLILLL